MDRFRLKPFLDQWFHWSRINRCFWPGPGGRSDKVDPPLAPVRKMSGIYAIAWGTPKEVPCPSAIEVQYIGMTDNFKNRMSQFASSAGIHYEGRYSGHSAAWRWPEGASERMHVAFFPLEECMAPHLKAGFLHWQEALAIDAYFIKHGGVPRLNAGGGLIQLR